MSDIRAGGGTVLNWRGPLLAAAIFAGVFAILLLMAHQNQSNTSDEGSSFRQDPFGASLLFDSYARAGYQVQRGQDEDTLAAQDASRTTAFFIGGYPQDGWQMVNGKLKSKGKFRVRLENFLARGGRVVLVAPAWELKSRSQGWDVENQWHQRPRKSSTIWVSPDPNTTPAGSEPMYLTGDAPWLKIDAHWTPLYSSMGAEGGGSAGHVYMAMRKAGKGELVVASQESFLLNETIKTHPNPVLLDYLAGGRPVIWVDETLHGMHQDQGVLWLVQRYRLDTALLLFWATLLVLLWSMSGELVRRPARDWNAEIVRHGEAAGLAGQRLLQRSILPQQVVAACWEQFRHRSPQDAQAIAADPALSARLRAAFTQRPFDGYKELARLIAERRASATVSASADRRPLDRSSALPQTISEEARIA